MNELLEQILSDIHEKAVMFTSGDVEFVREALSVKDVEAIIKRYMVTEDIKEKETWEMEIMHHESYDLGRSVGWNECLQAIKTKQEHKCITDSQPSTLEERERFFKEGVSIYE